MPDRKWYDRRDETTRDVGGEIGSMSTEREPETKRDPKGRRGLKGRWDPKGRKVQRSSSLFGGTMHSRVRIKNRAQQELGNPSGLKRYEPRKRFSTAFLKSCITVTSLRHTTYRL